MRLLDKRVGDLAVMQHAADQSLPMIRLVQANAIQLIEKFSTVRSITIPSWKRQFAIQLSLSEQKNAVELSNAIDIATLPHVHEQLIQTVEKVRTIHRDGMQVRRQAGTEPTQLREDVQKRLAAPASEA